MKNPIGMHYGYWSHNWDEIEYIPLIEKVHRLGFDICEVASAEFAYFSDDKLRELKQCADDNNIGFTYSIGLEGKYDLASDDASVREAGIRHITRIIESMPKVGATVLNGVSYAGWQSMPTWGITMDEKRRKEERTAREIERHTEHCRDRKRIEQADEIAVHHALLVPRAPVLAHERRARGVERHHDVVDDGIGVRRGRAWCFRPTAWTGGRRPGCRCWRALSPSCRSAAR